MKERITTPLGMTALAVASFVVGALLADLYGIPGGGLEQARAAAASAEEDRRAVEGELAVRELQLERLREIQRQSAAYGIPADVAASIHDIALAEGLDTDLAFRLVKVESSFRRTAVSSRGAVGLTQIKPSTARYLDPSVSYQDLFDVETNLRLGFRYLGYLMDRYDDTRLALLAYNRGPNRVGAMLAVGNDPDNGFARRVMAQD